MYDIISAAAILAFLIKSICVQFLIFKVRSVDNIPASSPLSECAGCHQQGHAGRKTLHQQKPPVLSWGWRLMQVDPGP